MNTISFRSFFSTLILAATVLVTGCAGSGGLQARADLPVSVNGRTGNISIGGQGSNSIYAPQQQQVQYQPQQQQACPAGQQLWNFSDGSRRCYGGSQQPQYQQQPQQQVVINNNNYQQPQYQSQPNWCGDTCNRQLQAPTIPAAPCRMVNVPVQFDQYGRPVAYQQRRQC